MVIAYSYCRLTKMSFILCAGKPNEQQKTGVIRQNEWAENGKNMCLNHTDTNTTTRIRCLNVTLFEAGLRCQAD